MKKLLILTALSCAATNGAYAATCPSGNCYAGLAGNLYVTLETCTSSSSGCTYKTCDGKCVCTTTCNAFGMSDGDLVTTSCPDACPGTAWAIFSAGYQSRCITQGMLSYCEYRCDTGYYGSVTRSGTDLKPTLSGCAKCPIYTLTNTATSTPGANTFQVDCYLKSGSSFSDSTGSGTFTSDCHYSM